MDYKKLGRILGKIMVLEGILMLAPLAVSFIYKESFTHVLAFLIPIVVLVALVFCFRYRSLKEATFIKRKALLSRQWCGSS